MPSPAMRASVAPVSFRVNPDVDARTHPYISTGLKETKFGVALGDALALYGRAAALPHVDVRGIDMHIGSQIVDLAPHLDAAAKVLALVDELAAAGIRLEHIDFGGGIGIRYRDDEETVDPHQYALAMRRLIGSRRLTMLFEPGRLLIGNAGLLLTRVAYLKPGALRNFAIVDAAMNDLLRPALYDAWHEVRAVVPRSGPAEVWQVVGPVCESADFLAHDRALALEEGDLLAVLSAGAYAMAMSSNYNSRARAAEVIVDGETAHLVRPRESCCRTLRARITCCPEVANRGIKKSRVQNRNTDVERHFKMQLNLVFQKKLARIQAAGVNGFVKSTI